MDKIGDPEFMQKFAQMLLDAGARIEEIGRDEGIEDKTNLGWQMKRLGVACVRLWPVTEAHRLPGEYPLFPSHEQDQSEHESLDMSGALW